MSHKELLQEQHSDTSKGQFLIYQAEDGELKIDVRFENESVWLTQQQIAELFQTSMPNVSMHMSNVYEEGELSPEATIKKFLTVRTEGKREVKRLLDYYNLDMIISVGYRVKSRVATRFRIWATQQLSEFIRKGFCWMTSA
ncbi:MAG: virulence RhuM family protein [Thiopseudomonas sp.]|nr:virulence RhuM family protein [Thiopseudomonas sp.]